MHAYIPLPGIICGKLRLGVRPFAGLPLSCNVPATYEPAAGGLPSGQGAQATQRKWTCYASAAILDSPSSYGGQVSSSGSVLCSFEFAQSKISRMSFSSSTSKSGSSSGDLGVCPLKIPCLIRIVFHPRLLAGRMSLSRRSPTMTASSGLQSAFSSANLKIAGSGFFSSSSADARKCEMKLRRPCFSNLASDPRD